MSGKSTSQFPLRSPNGQTAHAVRKDSIGEPTRDMVNARVNNEIFINLSIFYHLPD
jgi:hypothetical protein